MPHSPSEFGVSPSDMLSVIRGLRGVADAHVMQSPSLVSVHVFTDETCSEQSHWVELLERTVQLLVSNAYPGKVRVVMRPYDADIDASFDV